MYTPFYIHYYTPYWIPAPIYTLHYTPYPPLISNPFPYPPAPTAAPAPLTPARLSNPMDPGISPIPSITSMFFAHSSFKAALATRKEAKIDKNKEALVDANMRLLLAPSSVLYALSALGLFIINALSTVKISHPILTPIFLVLSPLAFATGILVCFIGGLFEVIATLRQLRFLKCISLNDQNPHAALDMLKKRFFTATAKTPLESRIKDLARRVDYNTVIQLKALIEQNNECPLCIKHTLEIAKRQAQKKLIIHAIGLTAILVAATGLLVSFLSLCPPLIFLIFIIAAVTLAIARGALMKGWLPSEDWSFSLQKAFPFLFVKDRISASITNTGLSVTNLLALG